MSQENIEVVRRLLNAFNRREVKAVEEFWTPDCTLYDEPQIPGDRMWRGHGGIRGYMTEQVERWEWLRIELDEFVDSGEVVVAIGTQSARGRLGGNDVSAPFAGVFKLRDDKVVEARPFRTKAEALKAAGLSE